ncbi:MAG: hypothetical protein QOD28_492 [Acidobacteriota bacterium]|nr:hypothetical protein [Acidobacteriota bacterium]
MKTCLTCQRIYADDITFCPRDGARLQADATLPAGQVIYDRYEIEELIAETRHGQLYRAHDTRRDRRVALEMFTTELSRGDAERLRRFRQDLRTLRFGHPNTVGILHITDDFMVMEYVEGQTLAEELRRRGRFTPHEVAELLEPVAAALDAARERVHDHIVCEFLTPADIMFGRAKNNLPAVKLLPSIFTRQFIESDTGHSAKQLAAKTQASVVAPYVAPELSSNAVKSPDSDARALVYSLGVISYELMSGFKPDDALAASADALEPATGRPSSAAKLPPDVSLGVTRVIERALAAEAKNRPATPGEFVSELQDALGIKRPEKHATESFPHISAAMSEAEAAAMFNYKSSPVALPPPSGIPTMRSSPSAELPVADKPIYSDENVQFTVYQPETIAPARWHTLLAFAHLSKRRPDAPPDEPEPLAEVKRLAARVLADETAEYDALKQNSLHAVPRQGEITFVPDVDGCEFNPPSQTFSWQKSVHKVEFELRAAASLDGRVARGRLTVFLGTLILADVPLAIRVDSAAVSLSADKQVPVVPASAAPYRKIFPSYSHKDRAVVEQIEHHVHALGDKYLRDVAELRAGQDWQRWMRDAIREADVFQLFWSHNSMRSVYVRQEWEYALSLGRANFVRPTYWEVPLPESPAENLPPQELRQLHFQHLRANTIAYHPSPQATADTNDASDLEAAPGILDLDEADDIHVSNAPGDIDLSDAGDGSYTASPEVERSEAVGYEQTAAATVMCARCGERNPPEKAFCQTCGSTLSATTQQPSAPAGAAQSSSPPVLESAPEVSNALDIFWEKRPREAERNLPPPPPKAYPSQAYSPYSSSPPSPRGCAPRGGSPGLFILLFVVALLFALAVGVYLLVRLL